ncbi:hypothetical protein CBER1_11241 [Cercospora berteroae]|uniref:Uncharacterized protein n=1 Tax=Cercospora berteroae TaxID=357750 RepID=A0A2S6CGZ4_9PEZI|nr:hypothetical protein CBER1_11241 [Cercospora berteroae]
MTQTPPHTLSLEQLGQRWRHGFLAVLDRINADVPSERWQVTIYEDSTATEDRSASESSASSSQTDRTEQSGVPGHDTRAKRKSDYRPTDRNPAKRPRNDAEENTSSTYSRSTTSLEEHARSRALLEAANSAETEWITENLGESGPVAPPVHDALDLAQKKLCEIIRQGGQFYADNQGFIRDWHDIERNSRSDRTQMTLGQLCEANLESESPAGQRLNQIQLISCFLCLAHKLRRGRAQGPIDNNGHGKVIRQRNDQKHRRAKFGQIVVCIISELLGQDYGEPAYGICMAVTACQGSAVFDARAFRAVTWNQIKELGRRVVARLLQQRDRPWLKVRKRHWLDPAGAVVAKDYVYEQACAKLGLPKNVVSARSGLFQASSGNSLPEDDTNVSPGSHPTEEPAAGPGYVSQEGTATPSSVDVLRTDSYAARRVPPASTWFADHDRGSSPRRSPTPLTELFARQMEDELDAGTINSPQLVVNALAVSPHPFSCTGYRHPRHGTELQSTLAGVESMSEVALDED